VLHHNISLSIYRNIALQTEPPPVTTSTQWMTTVNNRFRASHSVYNSLPQDDGRVQFTTAVV